MISAEPNTILVYSDIGCPWAHLAVHRLHKAREKLGMQDEVLLDHRAFALELYNGRPTPKQIIDAEVPVVGGLDPEAGWQMWQRPESEYPVTLLPALEAVQAAKQQSLRAGEELDRALRVALFGESRRISMRHEILDVARSCVAVDAAGLEKALDSGAARSAVIDQSKLAKGSGSRGEPALFLSDGSDEHNPGIEKHWEGDIGVGFPSSIGMIPSFTTISCARQQGNRSEG